MRQHMQHSTLREALTHSRELQVSTHLMLRLEPEEGYM